MMIKYLLLQSMARQTPQVQCSYRSLLTMWTSVTPPVPRSSARPGECLYPTSHGPSQMENPSELFLVSDRSALIISSFDPFIIDMISKQEFKIQINGNSEFWLGVGGPPIKNVCNYVFILSFVKTLAALCLPHGAKLLAVITMKMLVMVSCCSELQGSASRRVQCQSV